MNVTPHEIFMYRRHKRQVCYGCHKSLASSKTIVSVSGYHNWHMDCLRCETCNRGFHQVSSCYIYDGRVLCKNDYSELMSRYSIKCSKCYLIITASDWVRKANSHVYHLACFSCDVCHRQLSTGEQFTLSYDRHIERTRLLCKTHFAITNQQQQQQQQVNGQADSSSATSTTATIVSGMGPDLNGQQHQHNATKTSNILQPMDHTINMEQIITDDGTAYDSYGNGPYDLMIDCNQASSLLSSSSSSHNNNNNNNNNNDSNHFKHQLQSSSGQTDLADASTSQSLAKLKRISQLISQQPGQQQNNLNNNHRQDNSSLHSPSDQLTNHNSGNSTANNLNSSSKSKRVRTTFTDEQLQVLQTNFKIDSNPDGQDLERIATLTGLSKRVTQVWFQNSRARQKKYLTKKRLLPSVGGHCNNNNANGNNSNNNIDWSSNDDLHHLSSNPSNWSVASDRVSPSSTEASLSSSV